ncbi:RWD domain-containing protein 1 [Dinochytrium kinnereticum]|nr:RWD domain-containing protein 1 [Dinochytrium kinnereticum]
METGTETEPKLTYQKGVQIFELVAPVSFVDYQMGETEGFIRFKSDHGAALSCTFFQKEPIIQRHKDDGGSLLSKGSKKRKASHLVASYQDDHRGSESSIHLMDYGDEQANELEALKSIFFEEFEEIDAGPPAKFQLLVKPEESALPLSESDAKYNLIVTYTTNYPDEKPIFEIEDPVMLSELEVGTLLDQLNTAADEQLGMAMIFGVHSAAKEFLEELLRVRSARKEQEEEEKRIREEEEERARYAGTKVTPDSFREWKEGFLRDMQEAEKLALAQASGKTTRSADTSKGKFTGRQLFEKDKSLAKSDVGLLQEGDVTVDVDQELFSGEFDGLEDDEEENAVLAGFRDDDD